MVTIVTSKLTNLLTKALAPDKLDSNTWRYSLMKRLVSLLSRNAGRKGYTPICFMVGELVASHKTDGCMVLPACRSAEHLC